jgi:hypothetical protein
MLRKRRLSLDAARSALEADALTTRRARPQWVGCAFSIHEKLPLDERNVPAGVKSRLTAMARDWFGHS